MSCTITYFKLQELKLKFFGKKCLPFWASCSIWKKKLKSSRFYSYVSPLCKNTYRIRVYAAPGLYFSIWVFGWGSIQKIPQNVDFFSKKWGFIQGKTPKTRLFTLLGALFKSGAALTRIRYIDQIFGKSSFTRKEEENFKFSDSFYWSTYKGKGKPETQITFLPQEGPILMM